MFKNLSKTALRNKRMPPQGVEESDVRESVVQTKDVVPRDCFTSKPPSSQVNLKTKVSPQPNDFSVK